MSKNPHPPINNETLSEIELLLVNHPHPDETLLIAGAYKTTPSKILHDLDRMNQNGKFYLRLWQEDPTFKKILSY